MLLGDKYHAIEAFFYVGIMPELLDGWFSQPPRPTVTHPALDPISSCSSADDGPTPDSVKYCYCRGDEYGDVVGCDNGECPYQWFHLECLHLKSLPTSKEWYCPDCCKLDKFKKIRKKS